MEKKRTKNNKRSSCSITEAWAGRASRGGGYIPPGVWGGEKESQNHGNIQMREKRKLKQRNSTQLLSLKVQCISHSRLPGTGLGGGAVPGLKGGAHQAQPTGQGSRVRQVSAALGNLAPRMPRLSSHSHDHHWGAVTAFCQRATLFLSVRAPECTACGCVRPRGPALRSSGVGALGGHGLRMVCWGLEKGHRDRTGPHA